MKLKVKDVEFRYASVPILKDVCIELAASEMLGVVGPNGAGKSTLIRCRPDFETTAWKHTAGRKRDKKDEQDGTRQKNGVYPTKFCSGLPCYGL